MLYTTKPLLMDVKESQMYVDAVSWQVEDFKNCVAQWLANVNDSTRPDGFDKETL